MQNTGKLFFGAFLFILLSSNFLHAQDPVQLNPLLDQNISIIAEDEEVSSVIERICDYFGLDYSFNSDLLENEKVSLNVSNVPVSSILNKLMADYDLIFEIEDNLLVVRDFVTYRESIDYQNQTTLSPSSNKFEFVNSYARSVSFKFKTASNLIIVPVVINDSDTLNFILDTGVRSPIITELPYVNKLSLNFMQPFEISGLGQGEPLTAYRSGNNTMKIEGLIAQNQVVNMIIDESFQFSQVLGIPVHGLIGFDLFKDFVVEIDYHNEEVTLTKPQFFNNRVNNRDIVMPIHFEDNKPYLRTTIMTDKNEAISVKLLIDTGASDAIWLSTKSDERINIPEKHIDTFLGKGLSGDLHGTKGRISGLWIGPVLLDKPIVSFPDEEYIQYAITDDRNGTLGAEILRRFYVTINYPNKQIRLKPTSKVKEEFNENMSGLEITNPFPGVPIFTIDNVREGSPADIAGLKENDQILKVNRKSYENLTLNDINILLQKKEDTSISMIVLRNGEEIETSFILKKVL